MKNKTSARKRVVRWLARGIVFVFAALVLLLFMLTLSPGEKIIKGFAEGKLQDLLGQEVRIGSLETNLLSRAQVRDVQIYQFLSGDTIPLLSLDYLRVDYRLTDLLRRPLSIRSLIMDRVLLSVNRDTSGAYNMPFLNTGEKTDSISAPAPLEVRLHKAELNNATLEYLDNSIPIDAAVHNLNVTLEYQKDEIYLYHLRVDSSKVEYQGIPLTGNDIHLGGLWSPRRSRLDSVRVRLPGMEFKGNAEFVEDGGYSSIAGDFNLRGNPGLLLKGVSEHLTDKVPSVEGELNLSLHVEGSLDQPKLSLELDLPELEIAEIRLHKGLIQAELEPGFANLNQLSLQILGGSISGEGRFLLDSLLAHQLSLSVHEIDLAQVWRLLYHEVSPYQGKIHGKLTSSGSSQDPREWNISADMNLNQVKYHSKSVPDFSTRLTIQQSLAKLWLYQGRCEIFAQAKVDGERLEGQFSAKIPQVEPLAGLLDFPELTGELEMQGFLRGKADSPEIEARIEARNIEYQNFPVDSLTAGFLYRNGQAHISELRFGGSLDPIDTLQPPFGLSNISGGILYHGYASGPADSPSGEVTINLIQPSYGNIQLDEGLLRIVMDGHHVRLSPLELRRDSLLIQAKGEFNVPSATGTCEVELVGVPLHGYSLGDATNDSVRQAEDSQDEVRRIGGLTVAFDLSEASRLSVRMVGSQFDLERLRVLLPQPPDIGGMLGFVVDFSGNLDDPRAQLDFELQKPRFQLVEMDSLRGHFTFENDQLELQRVELYDGNHYSWVKAVVGLERGEDGSYSVSDGSILQGQAQGHDFDLRLLDPLLAPEMQIAGRGSYDLSWDGTRANPHPVGSILVEDGLIRIGPSGPAIEQFNLTFSLQDSVLNIQKVRGVIRETPFNLEGEVTISQRQRFDLQAELAISDFGVIATDGTISQDSIEFKARIKQLNLSLLQPFIPDLKLLSGTLNTELALKGPTADPQLNGHLEVRELMLQPAWLDAPFDEGVIKLDFSQNEVKVDSIFMRKGQGTILVSGDLAQEQGGLADADVQVSIFNIGITRPKEAVLLVRSAQLNYKKHNDYYLLDGDVVLGETRMLVNFRPQSILPFAQAVERPKAELPSFLQQTRMDVRLRESENIWVDNNLARLRLHTELGVVGSPVQPNLTGRVAVEEGYVLYIDRKFKIKQGVVDFVDRDRLNPIIDLRAEATVKSYRAMEATPYIITLAVSGPLDEVVVELTSDPPLDRSNIISLLTLGATRDQLAGKDAEGKEASASGVLLERAQSLSSQKIAGYTSRKVGTLLGLDQLTIEGNLFRFDESWGPQLLASKKISRRVEITYRTTVGHSNENSFRLDYWLSKHFSLEGETDQQGRAGMNLKYRLRSR